MSTYRVFFDDGSYRDLSLCTEVRKLYVEYRYLLGYCCLISSFDVDGIFFYLMFDILEGSFFLKLYRVFLSVLFPLQLFLFS